MNGLPKWRICFPAFWRRLAVTDYLVKVAIVAANLWVPVTLLIVILHVWAMS